LRSSEHLPDLVVDVALLFEDPPVAAKNAASSVCTP